jgi:hypothetical protein
MLPLPGAGFCGDGKGGVVGVLRDIDRYTRRAAGDFRMPARD